MGDIPYIRWKQTAEDATTKEIIRDLFPESSTYCILGIDLDPDERARHFAQSPIGLVHINVNNRLGIDSFIMSKGSFINIIIVAVMRPFYKLAQAKGFSDLIRLSPTISAVAVVTIHGSNKVWWQTPIEWKIWPLIYGLTA